MAPTKTEVIDYLSALSEAELGGLLTEARPDEADKTSGIAAANAEADRRFGKKV